MTLPTEPSEQPTWATLANYSTGADTGSATKEEPSATEKSNGFFPAASPAAIVEKFLQKTNWHLHFLWAWVGWSKSAATDHEARIADLEARVDALE